MSRNLLFLFFLLVFSGIIQVNAQIKAAQLADCNKKTGIRDSERRRFDDKSSIEIDLDGDGLQDKITPRTYTVKVRQKSSSKRKSKVTETHWITFDLKMSKGHLFKSFFKYEYGTNLADYWVYGIVPCRLYPNGRTDLFFYSGDDTSEESVILANMGSRYIVYSRKERGLSDPL